MRTIAALAALLMLAATGAHAQGPRVLAEWLLPGGGADAVAVAPNGDLVVAGRTGKAPRLVRFDSRGRKAEDWMLPGSDARPRALVSPPGALAIVAGPSDPPGHEHGIAVWRLHVAEDGQISQDWLRRFRRTALDGASGAVALEDGGLVVAGSTGGQGGAWLLKLDADGDAVWRRLALPYADGPFEARAAALAANGDVLVAAYGAPAPDVAGGAWVMRFGLDGSDRAQVVVDEDGDEHPFALAAFADNGWAVAGRKGSTPWLVRCDGQGLIKWDHSWTQPGTVNALLALPDGSVVAAGTGFVARLDADGKVVWEKRMAGVVRALALLPDGVVAAAGERNGQMWVLKLGM